MNPAAAACAASRAIMAAVAESGVDVVCLSPGSRSTPLVLAAADHPALDVRVIGDERSAGYYAVGLAKARGVPVAVVCTSGTAAANLVPAAAEAMRARVPIVLITADRPPEMRDYGAAQTIDQLRALAGHVRWQAELLAPGADTDRLLAHYRATASRAVACATACPAGPVHLNAPFREPFFDPEQYAALDRGGERVLPEASARPVVDATSASKEAAEVADACAEAPAFEKPLGLAEPSEPTSAGARATRVWAGPAVLGEAQAAALAESLARYERGLFVAGADAASTAVEARAIERLASVLGWPLLADPVSGLRFGLSGRGAFAGGRGCSDRAGGSSPGSSDRPAASATQERSGGGHDRIADGETLGVHIDEYDVLLRSRRFRAMADSAEVIVRVGGLPVSKALLTAIERSRARQIIFAPPGLWPDPFLVASDVVWADTAQACEAMAECLERKERVAGDGAWIDLWRSGSTIARRHVERGLDEAPELFEGRIARALCRRLGEDWLLWVGNSMPVRDLDTFVAGDQCRARVLGNRGASGIDGTLSSALGAASAGQRRVALLAGDLAFLHDVGGLQIAARHRLDLLIVVVNNDGGGIFSFLPQAALGETFERYFVTPHGLDLAKATEMVRGRHWRAQTPGELGAALDEALPQAGLRVVEAVVSRETNRRIRDRVVEAAAAAVDDEIGGQRL